jgi:hypothetical protein
MPPRVNGDALHPWPALHGRPHEAAQPPPVGHVACVTICVACVQCAGRAGGSGCLTVTEMHAVLSCGHSSGTILGMVCDLFLQHALLVVRHHPAHPALFLMAPVTQMLLQLPAVLC